MSCDIFAGIPVLNTGETPGSGTISGSGVRGTSCPSSAEMTVYLKQDRRFWFDRTLDKNTGVGINFEVFVRYDCRGTGHQIVYIEVRSGGKKVQSQRVGAAFCG
jgi:hypothetical protein